MEHIEEEKKHYVPLPKKYCFENEHEKEVLLARNFRRINEEVKQMLGAEIVLRYYYQKGQAAYQLRFDDELKRALKEIQ